MSLYQYKVTLPGGKTKSGQITAKTEASARLKISQQHTVMDWEFIREKTVPGPDAKNASPVKEPAPSKPVSVAKSIPTKPTKLDKLLYLQNGKCFFCGQTLAKAEASVEHLLPKSKGGTDADGNLVACCVTLNRTFGSMELKDKVKFVLEQKGAFRCPKV